MDPLLLLGSIKEVPRLLSLWFAATVLSVPVQGAFMVYWMYEEFYYEILFGLFEIMFTLWVMLVVYGAVQET